MHRGYVKLYRTTLEGDFGSDLVLFGVWCWILIRANRLPSTLKHNGAPVKFPPGTLAICVRKMAERLGVHRETLKKKLDYLRQRGSIQLHTSHDGTIISVVNWDTYQGSDAPEPTTYQHDTSQDPAKTVPQQEVRSKKKRIHTSPDGDFHPLIGIWNQYRGRLPEVMKTNAQRNRKAQILWNQNPSTEYWAEIVTRIARSDFCNGRTESGTWRADFDWLLQPSVHLKVSEGRYDNRRPGGGGTTFVRVG